MTPRNVNASRLARPLLLRRRTLGRNVAEQTAIEDQLRRDLGNTTEQGLGDLRHDLLAGFRLLGDLLASSLGLRHDLLASGFRLLGNLRFRLRFFLCSHPDTTTQYRVADHSIAYGRGNSLREKLREAEALSVTLLRTVGRRQFARAIAVAAQLRLRSFTLFIRTYDDARRAVTYLCGTKTDPNSIAPSLYGGRKRRKGKADEQPVSDDRTADPSMSHSLAQQEEANGVVPGPFMPNL